MTLVETCPTILNVEGLSAANYNCLEKRSGMLITAGTLHLDYYFTVTTVFRMLSRHSLGQRLKYGPVVEHCWGVRLAGGGQLIEGFRSFLVAQTAVAETQLDAGEVAVAVR